MKSGSTHYAAELKGRRRVRERATRQFIGNQLLSRYFAPGVEAHTHTHTHTHTHAHTQRNLPPQRLFGEQVILLSDRHSFCVSGIQNHNAHIQLLIICLQLISITMCYPNLDWYLRLLFYSTQAWRMIFQSTFRTRLKLDIACY